MLASFTNCVQLLLLHKNRSSLVCMKKLTYATLVSSPDQIYHVHPADSSKNRLQGTRENFVSGDKTNAMQEIVDTTSSYSLVKLVARQQPANYESSQHSCMLAAMVTPVHGQCIVSACAQ